MKHFFKTHIKSARKSRTQLYLTGAMMLFLVFSASAQAIQPEKSYLPDNFTNPLFLALVSVAVLLLIVIVELFSVLKSVSSHFKKEKSGHGTKIIAILIILGTFVSQNVMAQEAGDTTGLSNSSTIGGMDSQTFFLLVVVIVFECIIVLTLLTLIKHFQENLRTTDGTSKNILDVTGSFLDGISSSVPLRLEKEILLDHEYDGIKELDNNLPPWWKYGFYITIVMGVIYFLNFHVLHTGELQSKEYEQELREAEIQMALYRSTAANLVDETNVIALTDAGSIENGKKYFLASCSSCHGKLGQGKVGPNLTDNYWQYGGDIKSIFKIIKYGNSDKGMKAWKDEFSPKQINELASYIRTLIGTNPPNAKAPKGDLWVETSGNAADSNKVLLKEVSSAGDSLQKGQAGKN